MDTDHKTENIFPRNIWVHNYLKGDTNCCIMCKLSYFILFSVTLNILAFIRAELLSTDLNAF